MLMTGTKVRLGLDPGGTTGWALYVQPANAMGDGSFTIGHMGPGDHHSELYEMMERWQTRDFVVVSESFEFRQGKQRANLNLMSKEYIGVIKYFGQERKAPVVFQTAGVAKPFVTDEKLKAMGLWSPGYKHGMDAMRHLITYMVQRDKRHDLITSWRNL